MKWQAAREKASAVSRRNRKIRRLRKAFENETKGWRIIASPAFYF
jgi:hypothetical protein